MVIGFKISPQEVINTAHLIRALGNGSIIFKGGLVKSLSLFALLIALFWIFAPDKMILRLF